MYACHKTRSFHINDECVKRVYAGIYGFRDGFLEFYFV